MEKEIYKILPDGNPSGLSLNQFEIYTKTNSKWNNCKGKEIYSLEIFIKKIIQAYPEYENIENFDVLEFIRNNYKTEKNIYNIINEFIDGLASLIISLKEGSSECIRKNKNLFKYDWEFWKKCEYIIFDGKLIQNELGECIITLLESKLSKYHIKIMRISDFTEVDTPSLYGCSCGNYYNKQYVFDFGNTCVKRGILTKENNISILKELEPVYHKNFWDLYDSMENAKYVDEFISKIIFQMITKYHKEGDDNINISLCIANNIINNKIANRGSYRLLRLITDNYQEYLSIKISKKFAIKVNLKIYNDAEAVGRIFSNFSPNTAIITLGTLMGIAYPTNI